MDPYRFNFKQLLLHKKAYKKISMIKKIKFFFYNIMLAENNRIVQVYQKLCV